MRGYFYVLLVTSICTSLCSMMVSSGFEKYIKYIAALICVTVMISPFRNIDIAEIVENAERDLVLEQETENLLYQTSGEITEENTKEYISQIIFNKFGIKPTLINIEIDWGKEEPIIDNITVWLGKEDYPKATEIKDYLFSVLGGEVKIIEG